MSGTSPCTGDAPVSMIELLAAARAAAVVSTPPAEPEEPADRSEDAQELEPSAAA